MAHRYSKGQLHHLREEEVIIETHSGEVIEGEIRRIMTNGIPRLLILERGSLSPFSPDRVRMLRLSEIEKITSASDPGDDTI